MNTVLRTLTTISRYMTTLSSTKASQGLRVGVIGSGNWGTAIAKIVAENTAQNAKFARQVKMWVFEETITSKDGTQEKLTEIFNRTHVNVKYLAGIKCPDNILAVPDVKEVASTSDIIVIVIPHQFVESVCKQMQGHVNPSALALSCIKGVAVSKHGVELFADVIEEKLGIYCGALSGANIANEVAQEKFCETTIAFNPRPLEPSAQTEGKTPNPLVTGETIKELFHRPYFRVGMTDDVAGVSLCGALKNVVAVAAGFIDGLELGDNSKAAVMRIGLVEMKNFAKTFFPKVRSSTFTEHSCGVADLITSCSGGRNRRCAEAFVKTGKSMDVLEAEMLGGGKLQGAATAEEVHELLMETGKVEDFPLFTAVYRIVYEGVPVQDLLKII